MKRLTSIAAAIALASVALAGGEGPLGTKPDPISNNVRYDSGPGFAPLIQTVLVLGIVLFVLKTLAPKLISKLSKKLTTQTNGLIKVEESATFAGGSLYVVQARDKTLLLSVSGQGVSCLADLTIAEKRAEAPLFMDIVADAESRRGFDETPPHPALYLDEPAEAPVVETTPTSLLRNGEIEALRRSAQSLV